MGQNETFAHVILPCHIYYGWNILLRPVDIRLGQKRCLVHEMGIEVSMFPVGPKTVRELVCFTLCLLRFWPLPWGHCAPCPRRKSQRANLHLAQVWRPAEPACGQVRAAESQPIYRLLSVKQNVLWALRNSGMFVTEYCDSNGWQYIECMQLSCMTPSSRVVRLETLVTCLSLPTARVPR